VKITFQEWKELESLAGAANEAVKALQHRLVMMAMDLGDDERHFLMDLADQVSEGEIPSAYMLHPQPEWLGGDSMDPANFRHREPHIVGTFPKPLEG